MLNTCDEDDHYILIVQLPNRQLPSSIFTDSTTVKLASVEHWSRWIEALKQTAEGQNIWYKVDPDLPTEASDLLVEPEMPGNTVLEQYVVDRTTGSHTPTVLEAIQFYHVVHLEACSKYKSQENKEMLWVHHG
ncbi:hypothetical protein E4U39_006364 [Claviceps sp. Clav50 group G5]|nr:hypothetical protein E4U39_006364 [Claviceps sp. Clav50 group G5]